MHEAERPRGRALLRALTVSLCALSCAALTASVMRAQDDEARESRRLAQVAVKAYEAKDYAAYLLNMEKAAALRPGHPTLMYNLAGAHALAGHSAERYRCRAYLGQLTARGGLDLAGQLGAHARPRRARGTCFAHCCTVP